MAAEERVNILLGLTGSVASIKAAAVIENIEKIFSDDGKIVEVRVVHTKSAFHFFKVEDLDGHKIYNDQDEWDSWQGRGDPVLHIELRKWADVLIIAPLSANSLAKIANGLSDNLLTCICRAWDFKDDTKKILFAPAMNTKMWEHPITSNQVDLLKSWGYLEIPCISKTLMCNDQGMGAMAEPPDIAQRVYDAAMYSLNL